MGKIKLLIKYIVYIARRRGRKGHGIHSPFVYSLNTDVLNNKNGFEEYKRLKCYRRSILKNKSEIIVADSGAGSRIFLSERRAVCDILKVSASSLKTGKLLFRLAHHFKPETTVELGTSLGFGTLSLAAGSPEGKVYSLEACPGQLEIAKEQLDSCGVQNVELLEGEFRSILPGLIRNVERLDLVYFDGDHRKESLLWQFNLCMGKRHEGSVFIVGDINWSAEMEEAWNLIRKSPEVSLSIDLFDCGLLFFRKGMARQHYIMGYSG
jgi:predicted O-methyltransferase YrrM